MASYDAGVPTGGVELFVQDGRERSYGKAYARSFDHEKPAALELSTGEWAQFQAKVRDAVAGMRGERKWARMLAAPMSIVFLFGILLALADSDIDLGIPLDWVPDFDREILMPIAIIWFALQLGLMYKLVILHNQKQDELIADACSELARSSGGRLTAKYDTVSTGFFNLNMALYPHRVVVIAPVQQGPGAVPFMPTVVGAVVVPGAQEASNVQPVAVGFAEEP